MVSLLVPPINRPCRWIVLRQKVRFRWIRCDWSARRTEADVIYERTSFISADGTLIRSRENIDTFAEVAYHPFRCTSPFAVAAIGTANRRTAAAISESVNPAVGGSIGIAARWQDQQIGDLTRFRGSERQRNRSNQTLRVIGAGAVLRVSVLAVPFD